MIRDLSGRPRTSNIDNNWSRSLSPAKIGYPIKKLDQILEFYEYQDKVHKEDNQNSTYQFECYKQDQG